MADSSLTKITAIVGAIGVVIASSLGIAAWWSDRTSDTEKYQARVSATCQQLSDGTLDINQYRNEKFGWRKSPLVQGLRAQRTFVAAELDDLAGASVPDDLRELRKVELSAERTYVAAIQAWIDDLAATPASILARPPDGIPTLPGSEKVRLQLQTSAQALQSSLSRLAGSSCALGANPAPSQ